MAENPDIVFRDYNTPGVPASGDYEPEKPRIRKLLKEISGGVAAIGDYRGPWDEDTNYVTSDYVESGGSLWIARQDNVGVEPSEGLVWDLLLPGSGVADGVVTRAKLAPALASAISISVDEFGAAGNAGIDGSSGTDDADAFQAANDYLDARGGGVITYSRRHLIDTNVVLSNGVSLRGPTDRADPGNPFSVTTDFFLFMQTVPALVINPDAAITIDSAGGISCVYAFRKGMALDGTDVPDDFAGTAFTANVVDAIFFEKSSVIGFDQGFYLLNSSRTKFDDVLIDCNGGIQLLGSGDIDRFDKVHCYGVTQEGVTGHEEISQRSGYALFFGGTRVGGATVSNFFAYGYEVGLFLSVAGSFTLSNVWVDGTTVEATGAPLNAGSYGIIISNSAEIQGSNIKICCQGKALTLGSGNFGAMMFTNVTMWNNNIGYDVTSGILLLSNFSNRAYFTNGFIFNNSAVADSAKIENGVFVGRISGALADINAGGGDPSLSRVSYDGGIMTMLNVGRTTIGPIAEALTIPNGKRSVRVTGTGNIGDILNKVDNDEVRLEFVSAGSQLLGSNFRLQSGFTAVAGGTITLSYSANTAKWVEVCRAN